MPRVFFITGTTSDFGANLVQEVINRGDIALAASRNPSAFHFEQTTPTNFLPLKLDVSVPSDIKTAFATVVEKFGRVDVVVNNAGYVAAGPFEDFSVKLVREQIEVNFLEF